jgi:hypothetical protein
MGSTTPRGDERRMLPPRPFMNNVGSTTRAYPNPGMGTSTMPRPPFIRDGKTMTGSTTPPGLRQGMPGQGPGVRYPDNEDQQGGSGDNRSGQPLPKRPFPPPPPGFGPTPADGQDGTQSMGDTIVSGMTASAISAFTRGVSWMFRF